ncbi:MAG: hypothetical protein RL033_5439 [Pseudomonadota bacterium]|jgi:hypothetical protein
MKGAWAVPCCLSALFACGAERPGEAVGTIEEAFVNGNDDRLEYFELEDPASRIVMEQSLVALVPDVLARPLTRGNLEQLSTWGENDNLCPDEPFGDQPAAAFCSGVLVDWDLVLTSGHCVNVFALSRIRAVFGFYFREPGELALTNRDVYGVAEVVTAHDEVTSAGERLDYAWLRLEQPVQSPHFPAAVRARGLEVEVGDAIVAINAGGGVPFKLDAGGRIRDLRSTQNDYFVADTDTSEGSSGGPAFDEELKLVGTLARGAPDLIETEGSCARTDRESDPALAREQFTYAFRAVDGLCEVDPERWLCDASCESCQPPPPPAAADADDGCSLRPQQRSHAPATSATLLGLALLAMGSRRRARQ